MKKNYKLLATDLDGTSLYPKRPRSLISEKNKKFLKKFMDEGNKVVLVTGRVRLIQNVFQVLGQEVDVIGMNGPTLLLIGQIRDEHF